MPYLKKKDLHLYYEVHGQGRPIVFLHPPVMGHVTFQYQRPLGEHYQLILVDLINSGRSKKRDEKVSVPELAELVYELVRKLEIEPAILCGYSNGGSIAQEVALSYPGIVAGVVLIGCFPEVSTFFLKKEFQLGVWAAEKELLHLFSYVLPTAHFREKKDREAMAYYIQQADSETLKSIYERGMEYNATDRLKELRVPMLLLYGKQDFINQSYMVHFLQEVKDVEIVQVSGVAHQIPTKRSDECNAIIHSWMKRKQLA